MATINTLNSIFTIRVVDQTIGDERRIMCQVFLVMSVVRYLIFSCSRTSCKFICESEPSSTWINFLWGYITSSALVNLCTCTPYFVYWNSLFHPCYTCFIALKFPLSIKLSVLPCCNILQLLSSDASRHINLLQLYWLNKWAFCIIYLDSVSVIW